MNSNGNGASVPVSVVVIGVENLDASLAFYSGTVGLEVAETRTWQGSAFERYWQVPAGTKARCAFLEHGADPVGRIQLMEFDASERKLVRPLEVRRATGLFNLNLYSSDMAKDYEQLKSQGFNFWSEPARNNFGPAVGETLEAAFDGPDGVVINMIQLLTEDPKTVIGHIVSFISEYGRTPTGFTSVVTTAHSVLDMEKALAFYYGPLHMSLFIESILEGAETNRALCLPEDSRTRSVIVLMSTARSPWRRRSITRSPTWCRMPCRPTSVTWPSPFKLAILTRLPVPAPRLVRKNFRRRWTSICRAAASARRCWSATRAAAHCRNCSRLFSLAAAFVKNPEAIK
jgi:catechol 2,3-dioxygenase-like lactoylglutathione lyase family enzyme